MTMCMFAMSYLHVNREHKCRPPVQQSIKNLKHDLGNEIMKPTISTKGRGHINKKITNLVAFPSYTCHWDAAYLHKSPFTPIIVAHFNLTYHDKFGPCKFFSTHAIFEPTISYTQTIKYGLHFYDVDIIVCWWH
jgi:hypothetical protein